MTVFRQIAAAVALLSLTGCASFFQSLPPLTAWQGGARPATKVLAVRKADSPPLRAAAAASRGASAPVSPVVCGSKTSCGEMADCGEAYRFLNVCGARGLALGNSAVPCPALCGDTIEAMASRMKARRIAEASSPIETGAVEKR